MLSGTMMASTSLSVADDNCGDAVERNALKVAHERRELERAIAYWERKVIRRGPASTLMSLDTAEMTNEEWAYRFIIAVDSIVENCVPLFYGSKFAALLDLPAKPDPRVPMVQQLPARFVPVFTKGCREATALGAPVRLQGAVEREDGRREFYRAVFIAVGVRPDCLTHLAFGAFNCRVRAGAM